VSGSLLAPGADYVNIPFYVLDVFTDRPLTGNQLAVVTDAAALPDELLLPIAREFNLSETVFVYPPEDENHTARVRIFTPARELPFAGHPTVGCAVLLASIRDLGAEASVKLEQRVGLVPVEVSRENGRAPFAQFSVAKLPEKVPTRASRALAAAALSISAGDIVESGPGPGVYTCGVPFLFVELRNRDAVTRCTADLNAWQQFGSELEGIFTYTREGGRNASTFRARTFAPGLAVPEDPATGSAVAALAGYLNERQRQADGTQRWRVEQGYEMERPSILELECDVAGGAIQAVRVGGNAVIVSRGELTI
jgi:trans-2,3-dihydro-3-hydroxyanthranilate isomerase